MSVGKKILLGCGFFMLAGLIVIGGMVWLFVFYQPFTKEEIFKNYFDIDIKDVKNLKTNYYDFNNTGSINVSFEILDEQELDAFLRKRGDLQEKSSEGKTSFFKENPALKWWTPDKNGAYEFYKMKPRCFKKSVCLGYLYFDRKKKLVFAKYILLFDENNRKNEDENK